MDRYSAWTGGAGRPRRVPPRVLPRRRSATRAATQAWGGRWFVALGALALALLLPRLLAAQGLRSAQAAVTLRVTAPAAPRGGATWHGPSVVDLPLTLPQPAWPVERVELQLAEPRPGSATPLVRGADGRLVALAAHWLAVPARGGIVLRVAAPGGDALADAHWRVRYRLVPRDPARAAHEGTTAVQVAAER